MVKRDTIAGQMLNKLDDLGIADNAVAMYSTDNGTEMLSWPTGSTMAFKRA